MRSQLRDLDELAVRRAARHAHALFGERLFVQAVELEAVTMPLVDERRAVDPLRQRARRQLACVPSQPHRSAEFVDPERSRSL